MSNEPAQEREQWRKVHWLHDEYPWGVVAGPAHPNRDTDFGPFMDERIIAHCFHEADADAILALHNAQPSAVDVNPVVSLLESALSYWDRREVCMSYIKDALAAARIRQPTAVDHTHVWFAVDVEERRIRLTAFPALCAIAICGECGTTYFSLMHREQSSAVEAKAALADWLHNRLKHENAEGKYVGGDAAHDALEFNQMYRALPTTPEQQ